VAAGDGPGLEERSAPPQAHIKKPDKANTRSIRRPPYM
jgi:hypothetical protein